MSWNEPGPKNEFVGAKKVRKRLNQNFQNHTKQSNISKLETDMIYQYTMLNVGFHEIPISNQQYIP